MRDDFDSTLDLALRQLQQQSETSTVLAGFTEDASRLRPLLSAAHQLDPLHHIELPTQVELEVDREAFLAHLSTISLTSPAPQLERQSGLSIWERLTRLLSPQNGQGQWRVALARSAMIVMLLLALLGTTAVFAQRSLPSSPLYPLKLAAEDFRLQRAPDDFLRAQIHLSLAAVRVEELAQMAFSGQKLDLTADDRLQFHLDAALQLAAVSSELEMNLLLQDAEGFVITNAAALVRARTQTAADAHPALDSAYQLLQLFGQEAAAGMQDAHKFRRQHTGGQPDNPPPSPGTDLQKETGESLTPAAVPTRVNPISGPTGTRSSPSTPQADPDGPSGNPPATPGDHEVPGGSEPNSGNGPGTAAPTQQPEKEDPNREQAPEGGGTSHGTPMPPAPPPVNDAESSVDQPVPQATATSDSAGAGDAGNDQGSGGEDGGNSTGSRP